MKLSKLPIALSAIMIAMTAANPSWAHGGGHYGGGYHGGGHSHSHVGVGVFVGGPLWWPWYYPGPSYYYPPAVAVPASPPPPAAYIERGEDAPYSQSYWYYCNSSRTYYPYVQQCPEGWQQVMPRPPS